MAQHVIKRTLYVGLGGTGMAALLNTKKMFIETYGEVPPMVGFLGLDTDNGAYTKSLVSKKAPGGKVTLEANEQMPITVGNAMSIYNYERENLDWLPEENLRYLTSMTLGAGQVRTNGRFALTVNRDRVEMRVRSVLSNISLAIHDESKRYRPSDGDDIEIAVVFSICGGTGCGTFINTAYLLKEIAPNCKISGYAVLPNVFKSMLRGAGAARLSPNAYGAIRDLDYLMSMTGTPDCIPYDIQYLDHHKSYNIRPFDAVFFIDNKNSSGAVYNNLDKLTEMISLALVTSSGALASESASISDNVSKEIGEGNFNVDNKIAWASGMGACEIKISHDILEEIYSIKAAQYLVDQMSAAKDEADVLARTWIDSVRIRENDGNDQLIDRLLSEHTATGVLDIDPESPQVMIDAYLQAQKVDQGRLDGTANVILEETKAEFVRFIGNILAEEGGLRTASNVITNIISQVDIFLQEMQDERADFDTNMTLHKAAYQTALDDLFKYMGRLFKKRDTITTYCTDVANAVKVYVTDTKEFARRVAAISFFSQFKVFLNDYENKVENLQTKFTSVYKTLTKAMSRIENRSVEEQGIASFKIDLTSRCINKLNLHKEQIIVSGFASTVNGDMIKLSELTEEEVYSALLQYTNQLGATQEFSEFTIDDVFAEFTEEEFTELINSAIRKSSPLFRYSYHGRRPAARGVTGPNDIFFIGVPNKDNNRLKMNNSHDVPFFESCIQGDPNVQFASIGLQDRVIIFRQVGVVPSYTIEGINDWKTDYEETSCKCFIDKNLDSRMEQTQFSILPQRAADNREADQLELWVLCCIFNLIRNEKGQYHLKCSKGRIIDDRWLQLDSYRNMAFEKFKIVYKDVKDELLDCIQNELKTQGTANASELLAQVKANYMDDQYCHLYLEPRTLKSPAYKPVLEMIEKELQIVDELEF